MPIGMSSRTVFGAAFIWNLFWGVPLLVAPGIAMSGIGLPDPSPGVGELHARAGGLAVTLFGWIYWTIGRDAVAFRPFLRIAIFAKLLFFLVVAIVFIRNRELLPMLVIAVGDLAFAALFIWTWPKK